MASKGKGLLAGLKDTCPPGMDKSGYKGGGSVNDGATRKGTPKSATAPGPGKREA